LHQVGTSRHFNGTHIELRHSVTGTSYWAFFTAMWL